MFLFCEITNCNSNRKTGRVAHLVKRRTKKPGITLRFDSPVRHGIFLPVSALRVDYLRMFAQPLCAVACTDICVRVKNPICW